MRSGSLRILGSVAIALLGVSVGYGESDLAQAQRSFAHTDYERSIRILQSLEPKTGALYELLGKSWFMSGEFKHASDAFEKAVALDPSNSDYHMWLGRAYGRRAETANPFSAPGLAVKSRRSFEQAVASNPRNLEAIGDLFEYYLDAPGFLGGGLDKATTLATRYQELDPVEYHYALAKIAEHQKEFTTAEEQLRRAAELAPRQIGRLLDLGKLLYRQGKVQEGEAAFAQAEKMAPDSPKVMFARASAYIHAKQNLDQAKMLLNKYLKAPLTPEDPSREEARKLLKQATGG
jgi:tetratricopeptide (TPR) repeat protein